MTIFSRRRVSRRLRRFGTLLTAGLVAAACVGDPSEPGRYDSSVVAEGLLNPVGLALLPTGELLVAEEGTGEDDTSAGISVISGNRLDRLVDDLPSGRDSGDLSGVPMVGVSPDGTTVYTSHFGAESLLTFPVPSAKAVDAGAVLAPGDLGSTMTPLNRVRLTNAFDITFTETGIPVVTDASENGVATLTDDGRTRFIHRFGALTDPDQPTLTIDPVPTGITRRDGEYLVTLTGGCPYPPESGRLVAVDGQGGEEPIVTGLTMPIDVEIDGDGTIWILEFARFDPEASCFSGEGYQPGTGRLSRLDGDRAVPVVEGLDFPGSVVASDDGSLYVTEIFAGRVLRLTPASDQDPATDPTDIAADATPSPARPWRFTDVAANVGLDFEHGAFITDISADPVAMMGGGVCWLDAEGDGDLDLFVVNSWAEAETTVWNDRGGLPVSRLFRNDGDAFTPWSSTGAELRIRGNGCVATDIDGDGDVDLYVTADGPNALLINDGDGNFEDRAPAAGVDLDGWSSAAAAADVDGDGYLDLLVATYIDFDRQVDNPVGAFPQDYLGEPNHLFLGAGDGTFTDMSAKAGIEGDLRTLGALFTDLDDDGDLDLYLTNDGQANTLYENRSSPGSPRLVDITAAAGVGDTGSGMGVAGGDYDRDGATDLMVTNWEAELHALYRGRLPDEAAGDAEGPVFDYSTHRIGYVGLGNQLTGWGTAWSDFDNDTDLDLLIVNGRVPVSDLATDAEPIQVLGNLTAEGEPGQLRDWGRRLGLDAVGPRLARGAAVADYDNDGDLDIAINQIAGPVTLLRNDGPPGRHLVIDAEPPVPGTRVEVTLSNGAILTREIRAGSSYLSSEDPRLHVGLGQLTAQSVTVYWPGGATATLDDPGRGPITVTRPG